MPPPTTPEHHLAMATGVSRPMIDGDTSCHSTADSRAYAGRVVAWPARRHWCNLRDEDAVAAAYINNRMRSATSRFHLDQNVGAVDQPEQGASRFRLPYWWWSRCSRAVAELSQISSEPIMPAISGAEIWRRYRASAAVSASIRPRGDPRRWGLTLSLSRGRGVWHMSNRFKQHRRAGHVGLTTPVLGFPRVSGGCPGRK